MNAKRSAFTLIEIMIVMCIIAVLAGIAFPAFKEARRRSNQRACYANQKTIRGALVQFSLDTNTTYETNPLEWGMFVSGGYLQVAPDDPGQGLGSHLNYELDASNGFVLYCKVHGPIE
jgi:prepilin-type N-terminal cleavage/methylation domain-containing protein